MGTNVNAASTFRVDADRVNCSLSLPVKLHGVTDQKTVKCIYTTVIASKFTTFFFRSLVSDTDWTVRRSNLGEERDFPHPSRPALGSTQSLVNGYRVIPGGKAVEA